MGGGKAGEGGHQASARPVSGCLIQKLDLTQALQVMTVSHCPTLVKKAGMPAPHLFLRKERTQLASP